MEVYFISRRENAADFDNEDEKEIKGKFKVHEFNQEDDEISIDITQEKSSELVTLTKKMLNNEVTEMMLKVISGLKAAM